MQNSLQPINSDKAEYGTCSINSVRKHTTRFASTINKNYELLEERIHLGIQTNADMFDVPNLLSINSKILHPHANIVFDIIAGFERKYKQLQVEGNISYKTATKQTLVNIYFYV